MHSFNLKAVLRITGLTADTLRAWEKRYQAVTPKRNSAGRRIYNRQEVERLRLLAALVRAGHSISAIAGLSDENLIASTNNLTSTPALELDLEFLVTSFLKKLKAFKLKECQQLLHEILFEMSPRMFILRLFPQLMIQLGLQYERSQITVAQEHAASELFKDSFRRIYENLNIVGETRKESILLATPEGELHEFGLLTAAILLRRKGFNTIYLGPNVPVESILSASSRIQPRVLVFSFPWMNYNNGASIEKFIREIDRKLKKDCELWIGGGPQIQQIKRTGLRKGLWIFENMAEFEKKIETL